jgi:glutathione synthase/RimK-type ligase-like ATP-grasp enzyme
MILIDYKNAFYSSTKNAKTLCTLDITRIKKYFEKMGCVAEVRAFSKVDFEKDYKDTYVVYTSSEDIGLRYKSYIEDIMLFLKEKGAIIIPEFIFLRSHHNKSFMEMLRYSLFPEQEDPLKTRVFGTLEELISADLPEQKYVIKSAYGAGSKFVKKANNKAELIKIATKMSRCFNLADIANEYRKRVLWKGYHNSSLNRNKFIIQNFIEGLSGDFKVIKYGKRFYTLYRQNRPNDFRASGGGRLSFSLPRDVSENDLLDFAREMSDKIGTPFCSLDIAWDGEKFILIEFQCLCFGPYASEKSEHYYVHENGKWRIVYESSCVEDVFCDAVIDYIRCEVHR